VELPVTQRERIEDALFGVSRSELAERAARLSQGYRAGRATDVDALAYVAVRAPATFAAVRAVLAEVDDRWPTFAPTSMLDVGAGPGTASWAAADAWPSIETSVRLERDVELLELGRRLSDGGDWRLVDVSVADEWPTADLVVLAYVTTELADVAPVVRRAYDATDEVLVVVEPGTPAGFRTLLDVRRVLLESRATVLAPCPHEADCPLGAGDWCHFSQRLPRTRVHREVKRAAAPWEEERYCYVAVTRASDDRRAEARVLAPPRVSKGEVALTLCTTAGLEQRVVRRRDRDGYARAKRLRWGSGVAPTAAPDGS
jgi:ribosomal protein RSM22 (predicted rRNA methylase)